MRVRWPVIVQEESQVPRDHGDGEPAGKDGMTEPDPRHWRGQQGVS